jgi:hypothetical protein
MNGEQCDVVGDLVVDEAVHDGATHDFGVRGVYGGAKSGETLVDVLLAALDESIGIEQEDSTSWQRHRGRRSLHPRGGAQRRANWNFDQLGSLSGEPQDRCRVAR